MKDISLKISRILLMIGLALLTFATACSEADVEERVEMTLTAVFVSQPTGTSTNTSIPTNIPTLEPSISPTFTQLPPSETPEPTVPPTETKKPSCFKLLNPPDEAYLQTMGKLYFEWKPLEGAEKYVLEITAPYGKKQEFESTESSVMRWLDTLPSAGPYTWQVTALDADGNVICVEGPYDFNKSAYVPSKTPKGNPPNWFLMINTPSCDNLTPTP